MAQDPDEVTGRGTPTLGAQAPSSAVTTEEIRSQIVKTRAEMTETIDAIQERLSPGRLMTHAKETVKEATVGRIKHLAQKASNTAGDFARQTSETRAGVVLRVKTNPVPVALVGVAATWLLVRALRRPRSEADTRAKHGAERHGRGGTDTLTGTVRNNARFVIGAGAGVACWGMWKAHNFVARFPATEQSDANAVDAVRPPFRATEAISLGQDERREGGNSGAAAQQGTTSLNRAVEVASDTVSEVTNSAVSQVRRVTQPVA